MSLLEVVIRYKPYYEHTYWSNYIEFIALMFMFVAYYSAGVYILHGDDNRH